MDAEEETCHLFGPLPAALEFHRPGPRLAFECGAAPTSRIPNRSLIGAAAAAYYRAIDAVTAAARRLLGLQAEPADPVPPAIPGDDDDAKATGAAILAAAASALRRSWEWLPHNSASFPRPEPYPIRPGEPVDILQGQRLREDMLRSARLRRLAANRKLVTKCLEVYNSMHPGNEYKPAPGAVTKYSRFYGGQCWTYGNFVAHRKRSGFFSLLPTARTLFFFELVDKVDFKRIVTCTPLDEPDNKAWLSCWVG
ncbi:unnamed protein product [Urochloa humidicola]